MPPNRLQMPRWNEGLAWREGRKRLLNESVKVPAQEGSQDSGVRVHAQPPHSCQGLLARVRSSSDPESSGGGLRRLRPLSFPAQRRSGRSRRNAPPAVAADEG